MWESDPTDEKVKLDIEEVENLFAANAARRRGQGGGRGDGKDRRKTVNKKPEIVTLLDPKTANNTAIALSRIKMGESAIANALLCGDSAVRPASSSSSAARQQPCHPTLSHSNLLLLHTQVLNPEVLSSLLSILPSAEEVELVQVSKSRHSTPSQLLPSSLPLTLPLPPFPSPPLPLPLPLPLPSLPIRATTVKGDARKAEQFFLAIASVPRYTIRTKCMLTAANFPERAQTQDQGRGCGGGGEGDERGSARQPSTAGAFTALKAPRNHSPLCVCAVHRSEAARA